TAMVGTHAVQRSHSGRRPKAMTNVSKYRLSGATQSIGTGGTSVESTAGTLSIRLDGTSAGATPPTRTRPLCGGATGTGAGRTGGVLLELHAFHPHKADKAAKTAYPAAHATPCSRRPSTGSTTSG